MGFDSFIGNPKAVESVREMVASGRAGGSLLFTGPDGVGKKTLALMLAKALNCDRQSGDFCGECAACRKGEEMLAATREDLARRRESKDSQRRVEGLVYFDLQLIEPITRYILIEQIRQLRAIAYTRPFELRRRVFVIDEAQSIHWQAIDLLLKVLEEPPETTLLVLVCSNAYELRPTIRSRCRRVAFQPVEDSLISSLLASEGRVPAAQRELVARIAAGSIARAKSFDAEEFARRRRPWLDFFDAITSGGRGDPTPDWKRLFDSTKALAEDRNQFEDTLKTGYSLLRDLLEVSVSGPNARITNLDLAPRLKSWSGRIGVKRIAMLKDGLDQAYRLQTRNVNQQLGLDAAALDFLSSPPPSP
ncbi:MAG: ATP-binding protein [Terriglobia bacterium]